ncbi:MAG: FxsA family protein, partial [Mycobacteriales bacterium]
AISALGAWLLKREGMRAWTAFTTATGSGRLPAREVADGALVMFGGALLLTPGFLTDVIGLFCLLPPTRAVLRRSLLAFVTRRAVGGSGWTPPTVRVRSYRQPRDPRPGSERPRVIDGEVERNGDSG